MHANTTVKLSTESPPRNHASSELFPTSCAFTRHLHGMHTKWAVEQRGLTTAEYAIKVQRAYQSIGVAIMRGSARAVHAWLRGFIAGGKASGAAAAVGG